MNNMTIGKLLGTALPMMALVLSGANAQANHPTRGQMPEVKRLAHSLEDTSRAVHQTAERMAHHGDRLEAAALRDLHQLENAARGFHRAVETYYTSPRQTENTYRSLNRAFNRTQMSFHNLHAYLYIQHQFTTMTRKMQSLQFMYEIGNGGGGRVKELAHQAENASQYAHREAERVIRFPDFYESKLISALHNLEEKSRHFHRQVESANGNMGHIRRDYQQVTAAYRTVSYAMHSIQVPYQVQNAVWKVDDLLRQLDDIILYGGGHGGGGHDRWNRGGNGRRGGGHR